MKILIRTIEELPELLKNQIKAGEVITRPKDVVKEIMENALDAGSDQLILQIKEGGLVSISLRDNGVGIPKDQLKLALTAHATSKLKSLQDLNAMETMGFRGEALASIVSVSRVTLSSKTEDQEHGWSLNASEDVFDKQGFKPSPITQGTLIEIKDLFFNAKARREFLSSISAEARQIEEVVKKIALSRYDVGIQYQSEKKQLDIKKAKGFDDIERLRSIMGDNFANHALWFSEIKDGISVYGFVTDPQYQRAKGDMQYLFINGRAVKDIVLLSAIRGAYQDVMYQRNQPGLVVYIDLDPNRVDVNIHPTKEQVRIKNISEVRSCLFHAVSKTLSSLRPVINRYVPNESEVTISLEDMPSVPIKQFEERVELKAQPLEISETNEPVIEEFPLGYALAQLHGIYILSQAKDGLILVDMHAAHERVLYEKLKVAYKQEGIAKQVLLVPIQCELTEEQVSCISENAELLSQLGLDVNMVSNDACLIRALPKVVSSRSAAILLQKVVNALIEYQEKSPVETVVHELLSLIACHQAIRANRQLSMVEMNQLLREIENAEHGSQCNHGRPTWLHWTMNMLDGFFHRGQ